MSNFDVDLKYRYGCGVDEEIIDRFAAMALSKENPMPLLFSQEEFSFFSRIPPSRRKLHYAVSFCSKESLYKAYGLPYNFNEISFFYNEEENVCESSWSDRIFCNEGRAIESLENKISLFENRFCTVRLYLKTRNEENR